MVSSSLFFIAMYIKWREDKSSVSVMRSQPMACAVTAAKHTRTRILKAHVNSAGQDTWPVWQSNDEDVDRLPSHLKSFIGERRWMLTLLPRQLYSFITLYRLIYWFSFDLLYSPWLFVHTITCVLENTNNLHLYLPSVCLKRRYFQGSLNVFIPPKNIGL